MSVRSRWGSILKDTRQPSEGSESREKTNRNGGTTHAPHYSSPPVIEASYGGVRGVEKHV